MNINRLTSARMIAVRKTAIAVGVLYLITHVTSIAAGILYGPLLNNPAYITLPGPGSGLDTTMLVAAFLEVILVMANIGTGAVIFPIIKRQNEGVALSYLCLRVLEAGIIAVGILPILAIVTLRQRLAGAAGADMAALSTLGQGLVSLHNWTFIFATNLFYGTHTVLLAYLLYKSRLVHRFIPALMLIGGPAVFLTGTAKMFGLVPEVSLLNLLAALPALAWELSLATWLIVKGFNQSAIGHEPAAGVTNERWSAA